MWTIYRNQVRAAVADRAGAISMVVGIMSTAIIGVAGLTVDVGDWYMTRRAMQEAADASAIGGVAEMFANGTTSQVIAAGNTDAQHDGFSSTNGATVSVTVNGTSVTTTISKPADLLFSALFLKSAPVITVTASAALLPGGAPLCLLTTAPTTAGALTMNGSGALNAPGCAIVTDSTSSTALSAVGPETVTAQRICGPGGWSIGSANFAPQPSSCAAQPDPLANLTPPSNPSPQDPCQHTNASFTSDSTLSPGVYCGGITIHGNAKITFGAGTYILKNGPLTAIGNATLNGTGVLFYLTGTGTAVQLSQDDLRLGGNVTVNLTAPSSGPYEGIAFYQDHSAPTGDITNTISGNTQTNINGVLYFGNQNVVINGNNNVGDNVPLTAIIANTIALKGSNTFTLGVRNGLWPTGLNVQRVALTE